MSTHHLRKDKTCQNCGATVAIRYCTACGQENIETRQSFGHLLRHFVEDFTHYDGGFWPTIRALVFKPALLTKEYLAGKRATFVAPVKLYIFISFIAFFIPQLLPQVESESSENTHVASVENLADSAAVHHAAGVGFGNMFTMRYFSDYPTMEAYEQKQASLPRAERDDWITSWVEKKQIGLAHYSDQEVSEKFTEAFSHNFPKALFVYLPMFAFVIWLWHGKKRWYYFDHAIFTLHYFSFLLLGFMSLLILWSLAPMVGISLDTDAGAVVYVLLAIIWAVWNVYYLYRAHRKMYGERQLVSFIKSSFILGINMVLFFFLMVGFSVYTVLTLH